ERTVRELARWLVTAQEEERQHLARELHDQLGQSLTALRIKLDMAAKQLSGKSTADQHLTEAQSIVDDLGNRMRELSLNLRPPVLDDLGLLPALLALFERFRSQTGVRIEFRHSGLEQR